MKSASPKGLMIAAAVLAAGSLLAFLAGATLIGASLLAGSKDNATAAADDGETPAVADSTSAEAAEEESPGFFDSIRSAVGKAMPSAGGPAAARFDGNRPVGLYLMTKYWIATGFLEKAVWYFAPDGKVYFNPAGEFTEADLAANSERQGTARTDGDKLIVAWSDGKESSSEIEREAGQDGFAWDTGLFAPVEPFGDSSELAGRWEGGESLSGSLGSAITSRSLDIRADGTFSREAAASLRSTTDESTVSAGSTGKSSGTWTLDGYSLTMTFADGTVQRGVAFPFDDEDTPIKPDRFYFQGTLYKKLQ